MPMMPPCCHYAAARLSAVAVFSAVYLMLMIIDAMLLLAAVSPAVDAREAPRARAGARQRGAMLRAATYHISDIRH